MLTNRCAIIALKRLGVLANYGVYDSEHDRDQRFSTDIVIWVKTADAANDIAVTVSYTDTVDRAMAVLTGTAVDLIETLAKIIASHVMSHEGVVGTEVTVHKPDAPIDHPFANMPVIVRVGQTDAILLSLSLKGVYEAEDDSVLTDEIEVYGRIQAPSPVKQEQSGVLPTCHDVQAAHAVPVHDATRPEHLHSCRVVPAIDGDLGDVPITLMHTVEALSYMEGFQIDDASLIMRTKPVLAPGQTLQPDYWNAVIVGSAIVIPDKLFAQTGRIECELGRGRHQHWGARTVGVDIIQIEDLASSDPVLTLSHPCAKERAFALVLWILCEPDAALEGVGHMSDLLTDTPDRRGIIDAVDSWLEDPTAIVADSDQLFALRAGQASADTRELIGTLTGEVSQVNDPVTHPGKPAEPVGIPVTHTVIKDSGDDVEGIADSESAPEQTEEPEAAPVFVAETPAPCASVWSRLATAQTLGEASSAKEPEASEPELDESVLHGVDVPETEAPATDAAAPADETDAVLQDEAPVDGASIAPAVPSLPHRQHHHRVDETKASLHPSWHPASPVSADSPTGYMTRKIGTGTYEPSGIERPRWVPVFESKREESRSKIALFDWNFFVGTPYDVCIVDDRSNLRRDDKASEATVHTDGRSTIPTPGLPNNTPVGPILEEKVIQTGILRRVIIWPMVMDVIPIVEKRQMELLSITWVALVGFVCVLLGFLGFFTHMHAGGTPMIIMPGLAVVFAAAVALFIWSGLTMCRLRANKDTWIDAIGAIRVIISTGANAIVGSVLAGVLIGVMIVFLTQLETLAMAANTVASGPSGLIGLVWIVVALAVEHWCTINPDDGGPSSSHKRSAAV